MEKRFRYLILMSLITVMFAGNLSADSLLSAPAGLKALIDEALLNNNEVAGIKSSIIGAENMAGFEGALADPRLGISLSNLPVGDLNFTTDPMTQKQIFLAQKFPWPGKLKLRSQTAAFEADRLIYVLKAKKLNIARQIAESYYDLGYVSENIQFNEKLSELITGIIHVATSKYSSGRGLQQNIFQAEVELTKLADEKVLLIKQFRLIQDKLHALLNRTEFLEIAVPDVPELFQLELDLEVLKARLLAENPQLSALKTGVDKRKTGTELAQKDYYPDIDVKFTYGQREEDRTGRQLDDFVSLAATVNLPVWKRKRQDNNISSKKSAEHASVSQYNNLALTLPHTLDALLTEITYTSTSYHLYKNKLIPQSHQWATSALSAYEVGKIDFSTMIHARIQPLRFELKAKRYLFDLHKKRARLEEIIGGVQLNENRME